MISLRTHRKGTVLDIITIFVFLLIAAITLFISNTVITEWESKTNSTDDAANLDDRYVNKGKDALGVFNLGLLFLIVTGGISVIVSAFQINTNPAFFVFSLIALSIVVMVSGIFSNVFTEVINASGIVGASGIFSTMTTAMKELPLWALGIGALTLIVMFGKAFQNRKNTQEGLA